ncbi:MAG: response regulator, partial [Verrucomicrobiota bacterium]
MLFGITRIGGSYQHRVEKRFRTKLMITDPKTKKNVLIVEDDPFMQSLYRKVLEREGFTVLTAADGLATLAMQPRAGVDLVVLDLMLPKISGLKVLETIRAESQYKDLPVIVLSNAYLPEAAKTAAKAGATEGLLKSDFSAPRLVSLINDILSTPDIPGNTTAAPRDTWISGLFGTKTEKPSPMPNVSKIPKSGMVGDKIVASEVHAELMKSWPIDISMIRQDSLKYQKSSGSQDSEEHLKRIYTRLRLFSARATMAGCGKVSLLCNALEAMLFEHGFNVNKSVFPSMFQTMAQAVDCIEQLFKTGNTMAIQTPRKSRILLVDDDPVCNQANVNVLKRASFETVCAGDGVSALALLENSSFDLIFLDISMPGLTGFDACAKFREIPQYKETPIIFVSSCSDFQSRTQSVLCGSNGFISKPIFPIELILKALVFLFRGQIKEKPLTIAHTADGSRANTETRGVPSEQPKSNEAVREAAAPVVKVEKKVRALSEPLKAVSGCRVNAAQQASEVAEQKQRLESRVQAHPIELGNQATHTQELKIAQSALAALKNQLSTVNWQVQSLNGTLKTESGRRAAAEQQAAELAEHGNQLERELVEQKQRLEAQIQAHQLELNNQATRTKELKAAQSTLAELLSGVNMEVQSMNESLKSESDRRATAEREAAELVQRRTQLEQELADRSRSQEQLQGQLAEQQQRLEAEVQAHQVELSNLAARTQELKAAQSALAELKNQLAGVNEQVQFLNESLKTESGHRATAEQQAAELAKRRTQLERELAQRSQTQEQLQTQLAEQQQRLEGEVQAHQVELDNLAARTQELKAAQSALAALKDQLASVNEQVQSLNESLKAESSRRATAEQEAEEVAKRRTQLEQKLAEQKRQLDAQVQVHQIDLGNLATRTQELKAAQSALAELKDQFAGVNGQVQSLNESLKTESGHRANAEQQAAELAKRRTHLEQELADRSKSQEQLRAELAAKQQQLEAQVQAHQVELGNLATRTQEVKAAQSALAELKDQ